jgi:hypothetical protein
LYNTLESNSIKMSGELLHADGSAGVAHTPSLSSLSSHTLPPFTNHSIQADHVAAVEAPTTKPSTAAADEAAQTTSQASLVLVRRNLQALATGINYSVISGASTASNTVSACFAFSLRRDRLRV